MVRSPASVIRRGVSFSASGDFQEASQRGTGKFVIATAEHLADDCVWEANTRGITEAAMIEAAGADLNAYMLAKLNRAVRREVDYRVARDKF